MLQTWPYEKFALNLEFYLKQQNNGSNLNVITSICFKPQYEVRLKLNFHSTLACYSAIFTVFNAVN